MPSYYRLRDHNNVVLGRMRLETINELLESGVLPPGTHICRDNGPFVPIEDFDKIVGPTPWFVLDMGIRANWKNIGLMRASLLSYLSTVFIERDYRDSLIMVASELLENAVKYGDWDRKDDPQLKFHIECDANVGAQVQTWNPVDVESHHVEDLMYAVSQIENCQSPREAYQDRLRSIVSADGERQQISGLGLYRIAFEAGCKLDVSVSSDDFLHVTALLESPAPGTTIDEDTAS